MKYFSGLLFLIITWLVFVVSLATWWMIFSLSLISKINETVNSEPLKEQHRMLLMEGTVLILMLLFGGGALIYFALRERKRFFEIKLFFSSFSHDLKTSITRLILQGERLSQEGKSGADFQKNLVALEVQLENSLHLAEMDHRGLLMEPIELKNLITRLHTLWPDLKINLKGKGSFYSDRVALESIFKNLISNSSIHGQADEITIVVTTMGKYLEVQYRDNSSVPFNENLQSVGHELISSQKGSGLGLFLLRKWMVALGGSIEFKLSSSTKSLEVILYLPLESQAGAQ